MDALHLRSTDLPEVQRTGPLRFQGRPVGYFTHVAGRGGPAQVYRETVELAVAAEELGFASFWVAQHHAGALEGLLPSPLVLLAAVAERTATIRLGTAVVAASMEDPRRLAEDAAVLDQLSGGRLELGVGAGADPAASAAFGRDHDRRNDDCRDVVEELCRTWPGRGWCRRRPACANGSGGRRARPRGSRSRPSGGSECCPGGPPTYRAWSTA
ncbi:hypothetical protein BJF90_02705 [Pseudonocardia sp. CNS-004]|nr:hypothetical protein BJF90_02705 [Pseudonocardia sp. CNS-004]